jgi:hypothetical protein
LCAPNVNPNNKELLWLEFLLAVEIKSGVPNDEDTIARLEALEERREKLGESMAETKLQVISYKIRGLLEDFECIAKALTKPKKN